MLPYSFIGQGTFTNPATVVSVNVALNDQPDWFFVKNLTNWGKASTADAAIYGEWFSNMAAGSYLGLGQPSASGASITTYATGGTSGGFTFINSASPPTFASLPGTTISHTALTILMSSTAGLNVGDYVKIINPVGMLQLAGITAQITAVSPSTSITLGYIATAVGAGLNLVADGTACSVMKYYPGQFQPKKLQVLYVTQATQAKVYFDQPNPYVPGQLVDFYIPTTYGMIQLNALTGQPGGAARVLTVTNTASESSITINVNTSGFTAFQYPTTAKAIGASVPTPPFCVPAGSGVIPFNGSATVPQSPPGTTLLDAFDNLNQYYMNIGVTAAGAASTTMQWFAFKADFSNLTNA